MPDIDPEPHGHRGHPTNGELLRARRTGERIGATITRLQENRFTHDEATAFIAGIAHEKALGRGETWHNVAGSRRSVEGVLAGGGAKDWSLDAINLALVEISDLLEQEDST